MCYLSLKAKKKTVCQHFLKGYCRFGDKCWNEHPRGGGGNLT